MREQLQQLVEIALSRLVERELLPPLPEYRVKIDPARDPKHGDFASNIALVLAKPCQQKPQALAELICTELADNEAIDKVTVAGPGFINFYLARASQFRIVEAVLDQGVDYGRCDIFAGAKNPENAVQVEFVSANPTGPLHVGHGRGAAVGDSICRLLETSGWQVTREFYYNDAGQQIDNLTRSVQLRCKGLDPKHPDWPEDGYRGDYIVDVAKAYMAGEAISSAEHHDSTISGKGDADDSEAIRAFAVAYLRREQDLDLKAFDVGFDVFSLESSLYSEGKVDATVEALQQSGFTYENDGALWLKTTEFGDDKDRVMRKRDGGYTYFVPDVAYHREKWSRGFHRVINEQGADHHSTITRVRAGLQALDIGIPEGWPDYVLHQMVTVMKNGEEVKISKRSGSYVTLRDLIDQVGSDATRYFLAARRADTQMTFDIDLALQKNNENPVYYIQYAHARVCSALANTASQGNPFDRESGLENLDQLTQDAEKEMAKIIAQYPQRLKNAASELAPHVIAGYLREVAAALHGWYATGNQHKELQWVVIDPKLRNARLCLAEAARQTIANGLWILGVSAPESM